MEWLSPLVTLASQVFLQGLLVHQLLLLWAQEACGGWKQPL